MEFEGAGEGARAGSAGGEVSWRLLATLEVATVSLIALALCLHALRSRAARARPLAARRVLITKGETDLGQKLAKQFSDEGCHVTLLSSYSAVPKADHMKTLTGRPESNLTQIKPELVDNKPLLAKSETQLIDPEVTSNNGASELTVNRSEFTNTVTVASGNTGFKSSNVGEELNESSDSRNTATVRRVPIRIINCNSRSQDEVCAAADQVGDVEVLVVCGAGSDNERLETLCSNVSEEIYSNLHVLQEMSKRLQKTGMVVWVCREPKGHYSGAAKALQRLASTMLHHVAHSRGCSAVWCQGRDETETQLAARAVRTVARDGALPTSADVFREVKYRIRSGLYDIFGRFCKLWT